MESARPQRVAVIGGGPAGLMAAEQLACGSTRQDVQVDVYDAMPSLGRKFLMAGKGGMNITHAEPLAQFVERYGDRCGYIAPMLDAFGPDALRAWIHGLGIDTFVGSSRRVFPTDMKAAPLLRAWLHRLREAGVRLHVRHRWTGWDADGALRFATPDGEVKITADAVILALGGGSWARLGSDGAWLPWLAARGVNVAPLQPANCGFDCAWSAHLAQRFAGEAIKPVVASFTDAQGHTERRQGEFIITTHGVEGGLIYAFSAQLREAIAAQGDAILHLDLLPQHSIDRVVAEVAHPRGARSLSSHLHSRLGIHGAKSALLRECLAKEAFNDPAQLAHAIKALPLKVVATRPLDEAISSAGGVRFDAMNADLMLHALPGVFCAGEMLDWEAPTGGYLLTACFASGYTAGRGALDWLRS